jgi:hypothetical protein
MKFRGGRSLRYLKLEDDGRYAVPGAGKKWSPVDLCARSVKEILLARVRFRGIDWTNQQLTDWLVTFHRAPT